MSATIKISLSRMIHYGGIHVAGFLTLAVCLFAYGCTTETSSDTYVDFGFVTLDERILRADVIARVTMRSVSAYSYEAWTEGDRYIAMLRFSFDAHEYLKGSAGEALTVDMVFDGQSYSSNSAAVNAANAWISNATERWWEGRESIIFVTESERENGGGSGQSASRIYKFPPDADEVEEFAYWDYAFAQNIWGDTFSVDSERNRLWLPSASASSGASGAGNARFLLGDKPEGLDDGGASGASGSSAVSTGDISLSGLKARIKSVADLVKEGDGIDGYEECLRLKSWWLRQLYSPHSIDDISLQSGLAAGAEIDSSIGWDPDEPDLYFLTDGDAQFFDVLVEDDDDDPNTGYNRIVRTARPLPNGAYEFEYHGMPGIFTRCNFTPDYVDMEPASYWTISVTAPAGVLHEAFFDPASFGGVVGASVSVDKAGVLKPAEFKHNGANAALQQIEWSPDLNQVTLKLANPSVSLAGHHIDFIELDARVSLRLDFDDAETIATPAGQTLSWEVCRQPWHPGDLLMLRIAQSAGAESVTVKPICTQGAAAATPTSMPTPEAMATPTAEVAATPTAKHTPMLAATATAASF